MKSDKRVQQNLRSTLAAREILISILKNPEKYIEDELLLKSLKSQGGIAKLAYEIQVDSEVFVKLPMSLNTLKYYSEAEFDAGFEGLNNLRLKAIESVQNFIAKSKKPDTRSRIGLQSKIRELEEELEKHRSVNFILLQAILSAMTAIRGVRDATDSDIRDLRAKEGLDRIRAIARLNPSPFDTVQESKVVSIKDFKNEK